MYMYVDEYISVRVLERHVEVLRCVHDVLASRLLVWVSRDNTVLSIALCLCTPLVLGQYCRLGNSCCIAN